MAKTKLSSRGQIVIPKEIREKLGLSPGQKLEVYEEGDKIVLIAVPEDPVDSLNGMFQTGRSVEELRETSKEEDERRELHLKGSDKE